MLIRREQPQDVDPIGAVTSAAFRRAPNAGEPLETELVVRLRAGEGWLSRLSLVAVLDGLVIGHVVCTRAFVDQAPALGLGPLSVRPGHQGTGVGRALMHSVLGAAEALDERLVCLLGDPGFYARFGFIPSTERGVAAPDPSWGDYFQARALSLSSPSPAGAFRYAAAFAELGLS